MLSLPFILYCLIQAYILMILVWVFGSWFPQWKGQGWYRTIEELVAPYMNLFKAFPIRIGMMDLSPMLAVFVLIILQRLVYNAGGGF